MRDPLFFWIFLEWSQVLKRTKRLNCFWTVPRHKRLFVPRTTSNLAFSKTLKQVTFPFVLLKRSLYVNSGDGGLRPLPTIGPPRPPGQSQTLTALAGAVSQRKAFCRGCQTRIKMAEDSDQRSPMEVLISPTSEREVDILNRSWWPSRPQPSCSGLETPMHKRY